MFFFVCHRKTSNSYVIESIILFRRWHDGHATMNLWSEECSSASVSIFDICTSIGFCEFRSTSVILIDLGKLYSVADSFIDCLWNFPWGPTDRDHHLKRTEPVCWALVCFRFIWRLIDMGFRALMILCKLWVDYFWFYALHILLWRRRFKVWVIIGTCGASCSWLCEIG